MKSLAKVSLILVLSLLFIKAPIFVQAATPGPASRSGLRREVREDRQDFRQDLRSDRLEARTTIVQNNQSMRHANAQTTLNRITQQFNNIFTYLLNLKTLLVSRLETRAATYDISQAQTKLGQFDPLATTFHTDLTLFTQSSNTAIGSSQVPSQIISTIRTAALPVRADLKNLRQLLMDALRLLINAPKK